MKKFGLLIFSIILLLTACSKPETSKVTSKTEVESSVKTPSKTSTTATSARKEKIVESSNSQQNKTQSSNGTTKNKVNSAQVTKSYSNEEKSAITDQFLNWADERARIGGMAVSNHYFDHGASGAGDWYARSPDGLILVQQQHPDGRPGYNAYKIHGLGGIVFYYSKYGTLGKTDEIDQHESSSIATGYSGVADPDRPIVKYLLADNGKVYEFNSNMAFSSGFYVAGDDGDFNYWPEEQVPFKVSEDQAAQTALQNILNQYK